MNDNNNVQNQSSKNVYEEFADCIKEIALKEEMREKRVTWVEDLEKFSEKQETKTKENVQEDIATKEIPKLPEVVEKKSIYCGRCSEYGRITRVIQKKRISRISFMDYRKQK